MILFSPRGRGSWRRCVGVLRIVGLEVLHGSRNLADYEEIFEERRARDAAPITPDVMGLAIRLQYELAQRGQHRVPIPDLVISAAAQVAGLVVLHHDADFERIGAVGGAPHEWVVPRGSL